MGYLDFLQDNQDEVHNKGSYTHDAIGGLIAYEAAKKYEEHVAKNGKPDSHAKAKELLAGFIGAAGTQLVETKGADFWDEHKKRESIKKAEEHIGAGVLQADYNEGYGQGYSDGYGQGSY